MMILIGMLLASFVGAFVQSIVGFGAAVFMILYLTNFMSLTEAPSISAVICLILNLSITLQFRKAIKLKTILAPMLIYTVVSLASVVLVPYIKIEALTIIFGLFLIAISIYYLFLANKIKINDSGTGMMLASSSVSGLFAGLFSIGGPTLSIYFLAFCGPGDYFIASLQLSFLIGNIVMLGGRVASGLLSTSMIPTILFGLVGMGLGQIFGKRVRGQISTDTMSKLVYAAVGFSGVMAIVQQL